MRFNRKDLYFQSVVKSYSDVIIYCGEKKELLFNLAGVNFNFRYFDVSGKIFKRITELFPEEYKAYDMLGNIYALKNDYTTALKYFTMTALVKSDYSSAYFHRAVLYSKLKRYDKAEEEIIKARQSGFEVP